MPTTYLRYTNDQARSAVRNEPGDVRQSLGMHLPSLRVAGDSMAQGLYNYISASASDAAVALRNAFALDDCANGGVTSTATRDMAEGVELTYPIAGTDAVSGAQTVLIDETDLVRCRTDGDDHEAFRAKQSVQPHHEIDVYDRGLYLGTARRKTYLAVTTASSDTIDIYDVMDWANQLEDGNYEDGSPSHIGFRGTVVRSSANPHWGAYHLRFTVNTEESGTVGPYFTASPADMTSYHYVEAYVYAHSGNAMTPSIQWSAVGSGASVLWTDVKTEEDQWVLVRGLVKLGGAGYATLRFCASGQEVGDIVDVDEVRMCKAYDVSSDTLTADQRVWGEAFYDASFPAGLETHRTYFVQSPAVGDIELSKTSGGAAETPTATGCFLLHERWQLDVADLDADYRLSLVPRHNRKKDVLVIWTGANDGATTRTGQELILSNQRRMIEAYEPDQVVILGPLVNGAFQMDTSRNATYRRLRERMMTIYGDRPDYHVFDPWQLMYDALESPTANDLRDFADYVHPISYRIGSWGDDNIHLNWAGNAVLVSAIAEALLGEGYA